MEELRALMLHGNMRMCLTVTAHVA